MKSKYNGNVAIVVLNWNGAQDTITCVKSLLRIQQVNFRVVICDNDSNKADFDILYDWASQRSDVVTLLQTGGNLGFAGGVNVGIRHALKELSTDYFWILNNDTEVHPEALAELIARVEQDSCIGICGSTLLYHHDRCIVQALGGATYIPWRARSAAIGAFGHASNIPPDPAQIESRMSYVIGASMLVTRKFCESVGLMDERYFLYSEEHDWAHRGLQKGFKLGYAPRSLVYHKHGATIGTSASGGSPLSLFYLYRNKLVFSAKHYPLLLPLSAPSLVWEGFKFLLKGHPSKFRAVIQGLLAAPSMGRYRTKQ